MKLFVVANLQILILLSGFAIFLALFMMHVLLEFLRVMSFHVRGTLMVDRPFCAP